MVSDGGPAPLLAGLRAVQLGPGLAAAVCGRLLADSGAELVAIGNGAGGSPLARYLDHGKAGLAERSAAARKALAAAALIVTEGRPAELATAGRDAAALRRLNPTAALVLISPFGQRGPRAEDPASDLTLAFSSGIARLLTGQVEDLAEPPIRPAGHQSAFIGGVAAACAAIHAVQAGGSGAVVDLSVEEALATLAITELARAGLGGGGRSRKRVADGNGATVCILPACDGYAAISPREEHQWAAWLGVMGSPGWGRDARFARKADRVANWDALHALMSEWSRRHGKEWIAAEAQQAHVPSFPLREPAEQLASPQLAHRRFFREVALDGAHPRMPQPPFRVSFCAGAAAEQSGSGIAAAPHPATTERHRQTPAEEPQLPLAGIRVLDFSWVIAGPTATRYLAAMGAEIVKIEAPGRGDPGRASELHTVLGQCKRSVALDLKNPEAAAVARALAARSDVVIENFATGVMDRLGLGADALQAANPRLMYVSASGLGRTGPEAGAVAYGTLLQCYAGFAGLNRHPDRPPRVGMAWLDPMCGLLLAFATAAAVWRRERDGAAARIDFSMLEAMLWTMAGPLLSAQLGMPPQPQGNDSDRHAPHGAFRCAGEDAWIAVAVADDGQWHRLCEVVPGLADLTALGIAERRRRRHDIDAVLAAWLAPQQAQGAAAALRRRGIPVAALAGAADLVADAHLRARGFWEPHGAGVLPGLPWQATFGRRSAPAPALGADTDAVLHEVLQLSAARIAGLRRAGALG